MIRKLVSIALIAITASATALAATLWVGSRTLEYELPSCVSGTLSIPGWFVEYSLDDTRELRLFGRQGGFEVYYHWERDDGYRAPFPLGIVDQGKALAGFSFGGRTIGKFEMRYAEVPFWFLVIAFGIYPMLAFVRGPFRHWRRCRKGLCLACGYDLKGNVSGVCPECGRAK